MAKKQLSFAEKANRTQGKSDWKYVKYVKSVRSEKTGNWRFNEQIITLQGTETLDAALKRMEEGRLALDINLPDFSAKEEAKAPAVEEVEEHIEEAAEVPAEESVEAQAEVDEKADESTAGEPVAEEKQEAEAPVEEDAK